MKLLIITSLKEFRQDVAQLLEKAGVQVFSVTETTGFKDNHRSAQLNEWFSGNTVEYDSIFSYSFTESVNADKALELIDSYNKSSNSNFPLRAFVVPVEKYVY